jgi:hypothetical protein
MQPARPQDHARHLTRLRINSALLDTARLAGLSGLLKLDLCPSGAFALVRVCVGGGGTPQAAGAGQAGWPAGWLAPAAHADRSACPGAGAARAGPAAARLRMHCRLCLWRRLLSLACTCPGVGG